MNYVILGAYMVVIKTIQAPNDSHAYAIFMEHFRHYPNATIERMNQ